MPGGRTWAWRPRWTRGSITTPLRTGSGPCNATTAWSRTGSCCCISRRGRSGPRPPRWWPRSAPPWTPGGDGRPWPSPPGLPPDQPRPAAAILAGMPTLAVVGAGPKGIAIAAKARALAAAGLDAPRLVLIDPGPMAGNWTGHQGYTSGLLPLGTPPEKDIGSPLPGERGWGLGRRHRRDGRLLLVTAPDQQGRLRRLGRPRPAPPHPPAVELLPARGRGPDRGRGGPGPGRRAGAGGGAVAARPVRRVRVAGRRRG